MSAMALIVLVLQASVVLTVFTLGLDAGPRDAVYLFRRPAWLARARGRPGAGACRPKVRLANARDL
jgi:hypothetical protein